MEEVSGGMVVWAMERLGWSLAALLLMALLRRCWKSMTASQRVALGDAFEAKRDTHRWMNSAWARSSTPLERRALLVVAS